MLDSVANNHGFRDGNKRTAMAAAIYYLSLFGITIQISNNDYEQFMLHVVNDKPKIQEIRAWLLQHIDEL